jgi:hypothetical protein
MKPKIMEIDIQTNKTTVREMTDAEFAQYTAEHEKITAEEMQ